LLFHSDPEVYFRGAFVKIGFFEDDSRLVYQDEIHGSLIFQAERVMEIVRTKYLKALISFNGLQRIETLPVPLTALREAILNAITHKDYTSGYPIQISVYKDKLMIWNSGHLPPTWSFETFFEKHSSQPFNPSIAGVFFRAGMIEAWGSGIARILQACNEAKLPLPEFRNGNGGIWSVFAFSREYIIAQNSSGKVDQEVDQEIAQEIDQEVGVIARKILSLIKVQPTITRKELAAKMLISERVIQYQISKLKLAGVLKRNGSTKAGSWKIFKP